MYSEQEREEIFKYVVDSFVKRDEVLSVIQVGSGAIGYSDKYSDLDFAIVVDETNINDIFNKTQSDITEKYNVFFFDNMKENYNYFYLIII